MEEGAVFRASKRRKFARIQPASGIETGLPDKEVEQQSEDAAISDTAGATSDTANLVRVRKQSRRPLGGVHFSTSKTAQNDDNASSAMVKADQAITQPAGMTNRFVSSNGQIVSVDQHMVEYIDSKMAERRTVPTRSRISNPHLWVVPQPANTASSQMERIALPAPNPREHLSEVELGDATSLNALRTQAALERVARGDAPVPEDVKPPRPRKPRIGRDGKPMRPRPRKRRDSVDLARDALVEQVLHENTLGIYDDARDVPTRADNDEGDADEAMAERFKQEFLDAQAEKQARNQKASQPKMPGLPNDPKGPKLGGSRSARAKMAAMATDQGTKK